MKFFEGFKKDIKKVAIGSAVVAASVSPMKSSSQEIKQDKESFRRELGYVPNPSDQRKIYNNEEEYKKMVLDGTKSETEEYEEALLDSTRSEENKMAIQEMIKNEKIDAENQIKNYKEISKPYIESYNEYDKQKEWLKKNISSDEYKEKLKIYEGMNDSTQVSRQKNLEKDYILNTVNQYDPNTKETTVEVLASEPEMIHEGEHQIMINDTGMSDYAKDLYEKAFKKTNTQEEQIVDALAQGYKGSYYGKPEELDARKKVLEWDMERLGVKKSNEVFTDEHYEKLLKLKDENKLSRNSVEFLDRIDKKYINQIMNTIAMNNSDKNYYNRDWDYGDENNNNKA